jgi:hypothetical protein
VVCIHIRNLRLIKIEKLDAIAHRAIVVFLCFLAMLSYIQWPAAIESYYNRIQAQLSRLYSVVISALVFTALAEFVVARFYPLLAVTRYGQLGSGI